MKKRIMSVILTLAMVMTLTASMCLTVSAETEPNYLTFTAEQAGSTINFYYNTATSMEYRTNSGSGWTDWANYAEGTTVTLANIGDKVAFKGEDVTTDSGWQNFCIMSGKIAASGDVTSLTNGEGGDVALSEECYKHMFSDCSALTVAPNLPSTSLASWCYYGMFEGCTSLTTAPALPAMTLKPYCYSGMFLGCKSLTTAPVLSAKTLAKQCYYGMFDSCTSLTTAPALPATELAKNCYACMFWGCLSLDTVPVLAATTLAEDCYAYMFNECTGIKLTTVDEGFGSWNLPSSATDATNARDNMFGGTGGNFTGTPEIGTTYYYMAPNCLIFTSDATFSVTPNGAWNGTLQYSTDKVNWTTVTTGTTVSSSTGTDATLYFRGKDNTVITGGNTPWTLKPTTGHKINLTGNIMTLIDYENPNGKEILTSDEFYNSDFSFQEQYNFTYDEYLSSIGVLTWAEFSGNDELAAKYNNNYEAYLNAMRGTTLGEGAFTYMFYGQTSLSTLPKLSATKLSNNCYAHMFENCSGIAIGTTDMSLGSWSGIPSDASGGSNQFTDMFKGTSGTYTSIPALGTTYYYESIEPTPSATPSISDITSDSGYYAEKADAADNAKEGIIAFTSKFANLLSDFSSYSFGANDKFGIAMFKTQSLDDDGKLDVAVSQSTFDDLKTANGFFYSFVTDIPYSDFGTTVYAKPFAIIGGNTYWGNLTSTTVNANKWLGQKSN